MLATARIGSDRSLEPRSPTWDTRTEHLLNSVLIAGTCLSRMLEKDSALEFRPSDMGIRASPAGLNGCSTCPAVTADS